MQVSQPVQRASERQASQLSEHQREKKQNQLGATARLERVRALEAGATQAEISDGKRGANTRAYHGRGLRRSGVLWRCENRPARTLLTPDSDRLDAQCARTRARFVLHTLAVPS